MDHQPCLHLLCGKLASGKSTLAREIAERENAVLVSEDVWLAALCPGELCDFHDYLDRSLRFRGALEMHAESILRTGASVVFDFAGNIPRERAWAASVGTDAGAGCIVHHVVASDALCKRQLRQRNEEQPAGSRVTTEAEFDAVTRYFVPPDPREDLEIREHDAEARVREPEMP